MPYGHNVAICLHCGKRWTVGNCIPSIRDECKAAGHSGLPLIACPACARESELRREMRAAMKTQVAKDEAGKKPREWKI